MSRIHILTVADGNVYKFDCLGLDDTCRAWVECHDEECDVEELERQHYEDGEDRPVHHGTQHMRLPFGFGVETQECLVELESGEAVLEFLDVHVPSGASRSGSYLVTHEIDGDTGDIDFLLSVDKWQDIDPREAVSINLDQFPYTSAPVNEMGQRCPWPWEPQQLVGVPLGQYRCGYCEAMCVAGMDHLDYTGFMEQYEAEMREQGRLAGPADLSDPFADEPPA